MKKHILTAFCTAVLMAAAPAQQVFAVQTDPAVLDPIIAQLITADMSDYDKLYAFTQYAAEEFSYAEPYTWYDMLEQGGGTCWGSSDLIHMLCDRVGIENRIHDSSLHEGASLHMNLLALIDGVYYRAEAGYGGEKPRYFNVDELGTLPFETYSYDDGTVGLTWYYGFDTDFSIPAEVDGKPLTVIGSFAFGDGMMTEFAGAHRAYFDYHQMPVQHIETLFIPDSVTTLDSAAFMCSMLREVRLPGSIERLPADAFRYSEDLKQIQLPRTLLSIGNNAFDHCPALTDVWYVGTEADWAKVKIGEGNEALTQAKMHLLLRGDATQDNVVDVEDAMLALQMYTAGTVAETSLDEYSYAQQAAADIDGNCRADLTDAVAILRYYTDAISGLTPEWE